MGFDVGLQVVVGPCRQRLVARRQKEQREKRAEKLSQRKSQRSSRAED